MTTTQLPPRPEPHLISFDPSCFVRDGFDTYWTVARSTTCSGPEKFTSLDAAQAYAAKTGRAVTEHRTPRLVRVRWF